MLWSQNFIRKRIRALPSGRTKKYFVLEFFRYPFLMWCDVIKSFCIGIFHFNQMSIWRHNVREQSTQQACLDCSETLWAQSAEYDR
jgi:hypothetical protein